MQNQPILLNEQYIDQALVHCTRLYLNTAIENTIWNENSLLVPKTKVGVRFQSRHDINQLSIGTLKSKENQHTNV